jgi:Xaa-Pro aminopeptidase
MVNPKTKALRGYLKQEKLDAIVLFNKDPNFNYFAGQEFDHGLMVLARKANYLFISPLYSIKFPGFKIIHWKKFKPEFKAFIRKNRIGRVGAAYENMFFREKRFLSKHTKVVDVSKFLSELRQSKDKTEIAKLRKAVAITDKIFDGIIAGLKSRKFGTEKDIAFFIKSEALKAGAEMSFEPIVASGGNGIVAHHIPDSRLRKGFMVLDFGARYQGYHADMTRTVYLGNPSKAEREIYAKLLSIQESCIDKAKVGMKAAHLFSYCVKLMGSDAKYFNHGLGHGIGVEIHEGPSLSRKSKDLLKEGCIFTVEPGYYNKKTKVGIRIEDDVLLLRGGKKEILTKSTKELICIRL